VKFIKIFLLLCFLVPGISLASSVSEDLSTDLAGYWTLDETSGDAMDSSPNNANFEQGGIGNVNYVPGILNNAGEFLNTYPNADNLFLQSGTFADMTAFTWSFWVHSSYSSGTSGTDSGIVSLGNWSTEGQLQVMIRESTSDNGILHVSAYNPTDPDEALSNNDQLFDGQWHHIVITYDVTDLEIEIYIDGVIDHTESYTYLPTVTYSSDNTYMGSWLIGSNYRGMIDGLIDEVGFWSYKLSPSEVTLLWNSGVPLPYEPQGGPQSPRIDAIIPTAYIMPIESAVCQLTGTTTICNYTYGTTTPSFQNVDIGSSLMLGGILMFLIAYWFVGLTRKQWKS